MNMGDGSLPERLLFFAFCSPPTLIDHRSLYLLALPNTAVNFIFLISWLGMMSTILCGMKKKGVRRGCMLLLEACRMARPGLAGRSTFLGLRTIVVESEWASVCESTDNWKVI